jgi:uncharacterized protein (TIGR02145 family)
MSRKDVFCKSLKILISFGLIISCNDNEEPLTVSIINPTEGNEISHFSIIPIEIEPASFLCVDYYVDNYLMYSTTVPSNTYKLLTTSLSVGLHDIMIIAHDDGGRTASDQIEIKIEPSETFETGSVRDIEGNNYNTVKIGEQWWMAENLRTTKYNDGSPIITETNDLFWSALEEPGYCWYDNDSLANIKQYGALYNWYAAVSGKLCPSGWHVPSSVEVEQLISFLGNSDVAGEKLKAPCIWEWNNINGNGTNETGFSALPSGWRSDSEDGFGGKYSNTTWWANQPGNHMDFHKTWSVESNSHKIIWYDYSSGTGFSIRCVKD